jgi:PAS domain S-box-containing protein
MLKQLLDTIASISDHSDKKPHVSGLNYRDVFESMEQGFAFCRMIYDKGGKPIDFCYLYVNLSFARLTGLSVEYVTGRSVKEVIPNIEPFWIETYGRVVSSGKREQFENSVRALGKQYKINVWPTGEGCFAVLFDDITNFKKKEADAQSKTNELAKEVRAQEDTTKAMLNVMEDFNLAKKSAETLAGDLEKFKLAVDNTSEMVVITNSEGIVLYGNKAVETITGYTPQEAMGKKSGALWKSPMPVEYYRYMWDTIKVQKKMFVSEILNKRKNGDLYTAIISISPILNKRGVIEFFVANERDVTREKAIDKAKSEFVSLASHQLRTPLGIIKWYLEALEGDEYVIRAPDNIHSYIQEIQKSNERVLSLVRDLLSVSRIEQGKVKNNPTPSDLIQIIRETVEQLQIVAQNKKVRVQWKSPETAIPPVNIDALLFHEIIENLIGNAIEYSMPGGTVDLTVGRNEDMLYVCVTDTGIGISPSDQKSLFTKFFRSEKAVVHNPEGSGLGLYVVKSYVEGWGGTISVQSTEGKGSTFTISIPLEQKKKGGDTV